MTTAGLTLLIPDKADVERDAVAACWAQRGGTVIRLGRFWEPPPLEPRLVRVYGNDSFCLVVQQKIGFDLVSPPDDLILTVPPRWTGRRLAKRLLSDAPVLEYPVFVKPMTPKLFRANVYRVADDLVRECEGLPLDTGILTSTVADFIAEARCFVHDGRVLDCAVYEGSGDPAAAGASAARIIGAIDCPASVVLDLGLLRDGTWAVVEFNAAWGAGLNGCSAELVLPAIAAASAPQSLSTFGGVVPAAAVIRESLPAEDRLGQPGHATDETVTLYRPTGPEELELVRTSGFRRWPPRLPEQPIFYPVTSAAYAARIASDWNVKDSGAGFVTRFRVRKAFMDRYEIHEAGGSQFTEWWIPAEHLEDLNDNIVGEIEVIDEFTSRRT